MATLSGQTIQSTYPGLLKLADSSNPISSTYQQIEDGYGNNSNTRISTNGIQSPSLQAYFNLKPDFMGNGFSAAPQTPSPNTQNRVLYTLFYDSGIYSYSAITYNCITATTTSDIVTVAFYSLQQIPSIGVAPKDLIMSGITLTSNSTGVKTTSLPSTLSFSGTGGGFYVASFIYSNSGVTPTTRFGGTSFTTFAQQFTLGQYLNAAGTATITGSKIAAVSPSSFYILNNLSSFQPTYSSSDITTNLNSTTGAGFGFSLNVI
jgi:hypothetical protein